MRICDKCGSQPAATIKVESDTSECHYTLPFMIELCNKCTGDLAVLLNRLVRHPPIPIDQLFKGAKAKDA